MTGWECPRCGRCYAPIVTQCHACGPNFVNDISTTIVWPIARCTCGDPPTTAATACPLHGQPAARGFTVAP